MIKRINLFFCLAVLWFLCCSFSLFSEINSVNSSWLTRLLTFLNLNNTNWAIDKIAHFLMFYIQTILILYSISSLDRRKMFLVIIVMMIWALLSEQLQALLTTTRSKDMYDVLADSLGIIFASVFFLYVEQKNLIKPMT